MYAKSFIALDGNGRLTGARTAQQYPYDRYTCHLCNSALQYHPEYNTERPRFEHTARGLTEEGQHCPYVNPDASEVRLMRRLQHLVPDSTTAGYWDAWATFHQLKPKKRITLPSGNRIWQPEFPD